MLSPTAANAAQAGSEDAEELPEPLSLRRLRWLVTVLMVVMILAVITVAVTLVIRLSAFGGSHARDLGPVTAAEIALPVGETAMALGRGPGELLVMTRDALGQERLRVFDARSGAALSTTGVVRE
ncbi:MAG: DUF6476 family protein [Pseudomonadota bacterium]